MDTVSSIMLLGIIVFGFMGAVMLAQGKRPW